ncbi:MAG: DMT family transporter [Deltaproteobacteria bacterium]
MTDNTRAALLMVFAMTVFAIEDAIFKELAIGLPGGELIVIGSVLGALYILIWGHFKSRSVWSRGLTSRPVMIRNFAEIASTLSGVAALILNPLSVHAAITQAVPLVVTVAAILYLREALTPTRVIATFMGLVGVLLIIQPGTTTFRPEVLLCVLSVFCVALRDVITRTIPREVTSYQLIFWSHVTGILAGLTLLAIFKQSWMMPPLWMFGFFVLNTGFGLLGGVALTVAVRQGEASFITPFRYSRILVAFALGVFWFDEVITTNMLLGSGLLVIAGIWVFRAERKRAGARNLVLPETVG